MFSFTNSDKKKKNYNNARGNAPLFSYGCVSRFCTCINCIFALDKDDHILGLFGLHFTAYNDLADTYNLLKLGGSDYHGRGGHGESELGSVNLPVVVLHDFLKVARPIWCIAIKDILEGYAKEPSDTNLAKIARFTRMGSFKGSSPSSCGKDLIDRCLASWLTTEEQQKDEFEAIRLKLSHATINLSGVQVPIETK